MSGGTAYLPGVHCTVHAAVFSTRFVLLAAPCDNDDDNGDALERRPPCLIGDGQTAPRSPAASLRPRARHVVPDDLESAKRDLLMTPICV